MRASGHGLAVALVCLLNGCLPNFAAAQLSDQVVGERVLGSQWKQLSRRAGMIFAGTVLTSTPPATTMDRVVPAAVPAVQLSFRVDRAIAGVKRGQVLTIHEWTGAWSMHRPMRRGQHILVFLYPPSRLGLTSPVGGSLGQVALDAGGNNVAKEAQKWSAPGIGTVSVIQLERAIRGARREQE